MSSYEKVVKLACKPKNDPPKPKYIDNIIAATWSEDGAVHDVCKALSPRFREPNSVIVFKALIVLHTMIRNGATDNVLTHLSQSDVLRLRNVYSGNWEGFSNPEHLNHYAKYLDCRIRAYRDLKHDVIKVQSESNRDLRSSTTLEDEEHRGRPSTKQRTKQSNVTLGRTKTMLGRKLRSMTVEKGLLRETKAVHQMIDTLVECRFYLDGVDDQLRLAALRMLVKDLLILFQAGNEAVINLLEQYFEMSHIDAAEALSIYRHFCKQTEHVSEYLGVAKKLQNLLNVPVPNLRLAPLSLAAALQEYLDDPNFEKNRLDYKVNKAIADGKPVPKLPKNLNASKPDKKPDSTPADTKTAPTKTEAAPATTSATSATSQPQTKKQVMEDFFNSIEENQTNMFGGQASSPPNPFAQMSSAPPFGMPQITMQPTGFLMPQYTAMPNSSNPFGLPQQPATAPGRPMTTYLPNPDQYGMLQPQATGVNPFRQSMISPQTTGMALFGVGNNSGMGIGVPQPQSNPFPTSPSQQPLQPMATGFGHTLFNQPQPPQQQPQQMQMQQQFQPLPNFTPIGSLSQLQSNANVPPRPASTPLTSVGSTAKSTSPPPLKPHMTGTKNPFGPVITPAPPVPKQPTLAELARGNTMAGFTAPVASAQPQQSTQGSAVTSGSPNGFNFANSALSPGGTDMGSIASAFAFSGNKSPNTSSPAGPSPTLGASLFAGSSGFSQPSTVTATASLPTGAGNGTATTLKPQMTGFAGLKAFKPTSSFGAALMDSLPPVPNSSDNAASTGHANPSSPGTSAVGFSEFGAFNKQQPTGAANTMNGHAGLGTAINSFNATRSTTLPSSTGVGLRPQLTGGGAANPFRASMATGNPLGGSAVPSVPPLPTGFGTGNMFGTMPSFSSTSAFGSSFGQTPQGAGQGQQQGQGSLI